MELERIKEIFSVCRVEDFSKVNFDSDFVFVSKTDKEFSVVCRTSDVPTNTISRNDGWAGIRICGTLDFSLVGVISKISTILSEAKVPVFVVSTFDTDYIFVKKEDEMKALGRLSEHGYKILTGDAYGDYFMNRSASNIMNEYHENHDEWS